jgi:hypothetical protein
MVARHRPAEWSFAHKPRGLASPPLNRPGRRLRGVAWLEFWWTPYTDV